MKAPILMAVVLLICSGMAAAEDAKVFWRCADGALEAVASQVTIQGQQHQLYLNYSSSNDAAKHNSKIDKHSHAQVPSSILKGSYITLGGRGQWYMNCVGMLVQHTKKMTGNQVIFNVKRNAYGCPLIPKNCAMKGEELIY